MMAVNRTVVEDQHFDGNVANNSFVWDSEHYDEFYISNTLTAGTSTTVVLTVERSFDLIDWNGLSTPLTLTAGDTAARQAVTAPHHRVRVSTVEGGTSVFHISVLLNRDN
jgi:hypothetical protein